MSEDQTQRTRRRRSRAEVERIVAEYEASGLTRTEFCRLQGLALSTLNRYRKRREQRQQNEAGGGSTWVAVEFEPNQAAGTSSSGLAVALSSGRRIEVRRGFDAKTLKQLVALLERI